MWMYNPHTLVRSQVAGLTQKKSGNLDNQGPKVSALHSFHYTLQLDVLMTKILVPNLFMHCYSNTNTTHTAEY